MALYQTIRFYFLLLLLCCLLPSFYIFNFFVKLYRSFSRENVKGKVVIITGASSGIGEEMTYEYARRGASLVIVARREKLLEDVAKKAREFGSPYVVPVCADVLKVDDCKRCVDEAIKHFGRLDHVVNNAGIASVTPIEDVTDITKLVPVMDVNFWGSVYPTYYAIPHLKKSKGKIFVNASAGAYIPPPRLTIYAASKAALVSFYESLRIELGPEISITIATLGLIDSEMTQGKHLSSEGIIEVDNEIHKALKNYMPVMSSGACAKSMVEAICRKRRSVTEPKCFKVLFLLKNLCPELIDWVNRMSYLMSRQSTPPPAVRKTN